MSEEAAAENTELDEFETAFAELAEKNNDSANLDNEVLEIPKEDEDPESKEPLEGNVIKADDLQSNEEEPAPAEDEFYKDWPQVAIDSHKDALAKAEKFEHQIKSDNGRVSAFQKQVTGLNRQLQEIQANSDKDQPTKAEITEAMGSDESWDEFKEEYPEVATAIDNRLNKAISAQETKIDTVLAPVIEDQNTKTQLEAYDTVAQEFPKWQDAVKEETFNDWLVKQPAAVQGLSRSDDTNDASSLISLYDDHRIANNMPSLRAAKVDDIVDDVDDSADDLAAKRERQLKAGEVIPSKSARINPDQEGGDDEFERAFNAFAARDEANRA